MDWIWIVACVVLVGGPIWLYNSCVRLRNRAHEAFSGVDVQLARRHNVVPNIVKTVKAYAAHEQETLTEVIRMRGGATEARSIPEREQWEGGLSRSLGKLLLLVERYPDLKADAGFRKLHDDLVEIEDHLQYARRYYNGTVRDFNTRIQQFPANVVAGVWNFEPLEFFQLDDPEDAEPPPLERS